MSVSLGGNFLQTGPNVQEGDTVIVYLNYGHAHCIKVTRGLTLAMRFGALRHEFLIGQPYGSRISATAGYVHVLRASPELWTVTLPHRTQILYTPDASLITTLLELKPGSLVAESGTGSGSLSHAILRTVAPNGHLFTFDIDCQRVKKAKEEFEEHGFGQLVTVAERDVCTVGFGLENTVSAVFLDLPQPWLAVESAKHALLKCQMGRFVAFSPCIEQVQRTAEALRNGGFLCVETVELVPRKYRVVENEQENLGFGDSAEKRLANVPYPAQQPTHTGYITSATLLPRND